MGMSRRSRSVTCAPAARKASPAAFANFLLNEPLRVLPANTRILGVDIVPIEVALPSLQVRDGLGRGQVADYFNVKVDWPVLTPSFLVSLANSACSSVVSASKISVIHAACLGKISAISRLPFA